MRKEVIIEVWEFWLSVVTIVALSLMLLFSVVNSDMLIESYDTKIEAYDSEIKLYQDKIDNYEKEMYELRASERDNKFVIDASLINTEMLNFKLEEGNLLTGD